MVVFTVIKSAGNHTSDSLGLALLKERSLFSGNYWYWIGVGALLGYTVLFNILFTLFLANLNRKFLILFCIHKAVTIFHCKPLC